MTNFPPLEISEYGRVCEINKYFNLCYYLTYPHPHKPNNIAKFSICAANKVMIYLILILIFFSFSDEVEGGTYQMLISPPAQEQQERNTGSARIRGQKLSRWIKVGNPGPFWIWQGAGEVFLK